MSYKEWFEEHAKKHKEIVQRLLAQGFGKEQIIEYFEFSNMAETEPSFCPLYAQNKKCHDMEHLNCYLCACPNFRFSDGGIKKVKERTMYSFCAIDSKEGKAGVYGDAIHQDCSGCTVPHTKENVTRHFDTDWKKIMALCVVD